MTKIYVISDIFNGIQVKYATISKTTRKAYIQDYDVRRKLFVTKSFRPGIDFYLEYNTALVALKRKIIDREESYVNKLIEIRKLKDTWCSD
jgi:hypothetical protein